MAATVSEAWGLFIGGMGLNWISVSFILFAFIEESWRSWHKNKSRPLTEVIWGGVRGTLFAGAIVFLMCLLRAPYSLLEKERVKGQLLVEESKKLKEAGAEKEKQENALVTSAKKEAERKKKVRVGLADLITDGKENFQRSMESDTKGNGTPVFNEWCDKVRAFLLKNTDRSYVVRFDNFTTKRDPQGGISNLGTILKRRWREKWECLQEFINDFK